MKVLITGITGMVGSYLARELLASASPPEIFGTYRWRSRMENVDGLKGKIQLQECDVRDGSSVRRLVSDVKPDHIYHLAAQSNVMTSFHAPADTLATNVMGLVQLLEAVRELHPKARVLVPGSSEMYGLQHPEELPIVETNDPRPVSPYGVSKVSQDMAAYQYAESYKLHIVRTRAFNHTGPGREDVFVESNFARQIAEIEAGLRPPAVHVGNLDIRRDYSDVRDIVKAYVMAMDKAVPGEAYNICSEKPTTIHQILELLLGMADRPIEIVRDPQRVRDKEAPAIIGSSERFRLKTGWHPTIPLEQTLREILDYWRARVKASVVA